jgi:hypothetical protein
MSIRLIYLDVISGEMLQAVCIYNLAALNRSLLGPKNKKFWKKMILGDLASSCIIYHLHICTAPQTQSHSGWIRRAPRLTITPLTHHHLGTWKTFANRHTISISTVATAYRYHANLIWICGSSLSTLSTHSYFVFSIKSPSGLGGGGLD